jgi:hypothetical protein
MATITLTLPTAGTVITAGLHATNYTAIQGAINGGLDTANWASGKIFAPSKFLQEGATNGQAIVWNGSIWAPATPSSAPAYGTTLPGSPTDGQEAILVDSITLPTYQWRFRWNAGSSNADKWEFVGGSAVVVEVATSETTTSATYAALATAGPSFTLPRAGVYVIEQGFRVSSLAANMGVFMSYDIGGTGAADADSAQGTALGSPGEGTISRTRLKTGLTAVALVSKYRNNSGGSAAGFADRWMRVTPVRVS